MESLVNIYKGRRVFVTGHTGFKGSWLCEWLLGLGAEVYGFSNGLPTKPALFTQLRLSRRISRDIRGDVRDTTAVRAAVEAGEISPSRYRSYLRLREELKDLKEWNIRN